MACSSLGIASAKLDFGAAALAGPAFSTLAGNEWADSYASYVICGRFSADLGAIALRDSTVIAAILKFRSSSNGLKLRENVLSRLVANEGADASIAINGALREAIPLRILEETRDGFIGFYASREASKGQYTAFWNDQRCSEDAIGLWRKNSQRILNKIVNEQGIKPYDYCPCGSGEKFRFCCHEALWRE
jgi:hypothetical protein